MMMLLSLLRGISSLGYPLSVFNKNSTLRLDVTFITMTRGYHDFVFIAPRYLDLTFITRGYLDVISRMSQDDMEDLMMLFRLFLLASYLLPPPLFRE